MLFQLVELDQGINKKDNMPYYRCTIMGKFLTFGKVKIVTQEVNISMEDYLFLSGKEEKMIDISMVYAKSEFPMTLFAPIDQKQNIKV